MLHVHVVQEDMEGNLKNDELKNKITRLEEENNMLKLKNEILINMVSTLKL